MGLFEIQSEHFAGEVKVIKPTTFPDNRGSLTVTYLENEFKAIGLPKFVRQMRTQSNRDVVRGLHFQFTPAMGKLIEVTEGEVFLVSVDMRYDSPTFLKYYGIYVSDENKLQVWASSEFARGYWVTSRRATVQYSCDEYQGEDYAIRWNDPSIGVVWPCDQPILSERDKNAPTVKEFFGRTT